MSKATQTKESLKELEEFLKIPDFYIDRELATRSFFEFFKQAMIDFEPETDWIFNWHHEYICDLLQEEIFRIKDKKPKGKDLVFNLPPGTSKSMIVAVCLTAWAWIHIPWLRVGLTSYNRSLAVDHCVKCRDLIKSDWYQSRWGDLFKLKIDENTKSVFGNDKGGERRAGAETGKHFDIIIGDDLTNPQLAYSEAERDSVQRKWFKVVPTRFKNLQNGLKIVIQQRVHEEDICGIIEDRKLDNRYKWVVIPAELTEDLQPKELKKYYKNKLFWPERFSKSILQEKEFELRSVDYTAQFQQSPIPEEGIIFKRDEFKFFTEDDLPKDVVKNFYTDSALGGENSAQTATICWTVHKGNIYIWDVLTSHNKISKWIPEYRQFVELNGGNYLSSHFFENAANAKDFEDELREITDYNLILDTLPSKQSKVVRAELTAPKVKAGRVFLLKDGHWVDKFIKELISFPNARLKDQVDAFSGLVRRSNLTYNKQEEGESKEKKKSLAERF